MKNDQYLEEMMRKVAFLDLIVGLALGGLVYLIFRSYIWVSLLGFLMAVISFYINTLVVKYSVSDKTNNGKAVIMLGFVLRILLISTLGIILYKYNKFNIIAYMFGFSFRFISLVIYGLIMRNK